MQYAVLLALSLFLGFAFEQFQGEELPARAGGVRTLPILAFLGAGLYLIEPHLCLAFIAGMIVLGAWIRSGPGGLLTKTTVMLAYVLGPITLSQPLWFAVGLVVAAVLLVGSKQRLHALTSAVPEAEVQTLAQFLLLVGVVLPLLYNQAPIPFTHITPFKVWLAVVAVSGMSYISYLLQRYVFPKSGVVLTAVLGGLYSSTATTVVLARRAHDEGFSAEICAGIIAATSMMYLRILAIVVAFNPSLGARLALAMLALAVLGLIVAAALTRAKMLVPDEHPPAPNPLQLGTAVIFASLLIIISVLSQWVQVTLGAAGILGLAAVVGITDIDPFVVSIAQGGNASIAIGVASAAILIAISSNNLLKAVYTFAFSRNATSMIPGGVLVGLSLFGVVAAWMLH
jgi:uncharacterized membrane protein (DUF4010 family)